MACLSPTYVLTLPRRPTRLNHTCYVTFLRSRPKTLNPYWIVVVSSSPLIDRAIWRLSSTLSMGKKRKQRETDTSAALAAADSKERKKDDVAPPRPKRTLLGWKEKPEGKDGVSPPFRNKEKVLVTCSRRIVFRQFLEYFSNIFLQFVFVDFLIKYRHLMLNLVSLLPHCKKDNKVESKDGKGATLNEWSLEFLSVDLGILFFVLMRAGDFELLCSSPEGFKKRFLILWIVRWMMHRCL
ncbi:hypothetical protein ACLOJK_020348 [Asimina triloba]